MMMAQSRISEPGNYQKKDEEDDERVCVQERTEDVECGF